VDADAEVPDEPENRAKLEVVLNLRHLVEKGAEPEDAEVAEGDKLIIDKYNGNI
jgi:hypothetical protein